MLLTRQRFLLSFLLVTSVSRASENFLLLERPQQLVIFNQYQQRITAEEQTQFLPFTPFRILKENDFLSDGFTACMRVEAGSREFFFEKDEDGKLHGADGAGFQTIVRDVSVARDTVEILRSNRLTSADKSKTARVDEGGRVARVFRQNGLTYAKLLGANEQYGWIELGAVNKDWKKAEKLGKSVAEQIERVLPRVEGKINEVNVKFGRLFDHLNRRASRQLQQPQWRVQRLGKTIVCELATALPSENFAASTRLLGKSFEGILLGTDLRVFESAGKIEIR